MKKALFLCTVILLFCVPLLTLTSCECAHEWKVAHISTPATCLAEGKQTLRCEKCNAEKEEILSISKCDYDMENAIWEWTDYEAASVQVTCKTDAAHKATLKATISSQKTEPSCSAEGEICYVASVTINDATYTNTKTEIIPMHFYNAGQRTAPMPLKDGVIKRTCTKCKHVDEEILPATKTLKVLAIGNSFSDDATEYLWSICHDAGVEDLVVGNLYIGSCSLDKHYANITENVSAYTYRKNNSGKRVDTANTSIATALADEDWDVITIQQVSGDSGDPETFGKLEAILDYLAKEKPDATVYWHMTWAYQTGSSHSSFPKYNKSQLTMYNSIVSAYLDEVAPLKQIKGAIPAGTAIQNLRTSYIGDTLTRDGYHMSNDYGRYTVALTWYAYLTGGAPELVSWVPSQYEYIVWDIDAIRESVHNALSTPLENTYSEHQIQRLKTDFERFEELGLDLNDYKRLEWDAFFQSYYNSLYLGMKLYNSQNSTDSNLKYYLASPLFTKETLPVGSVIVLDKGYQYRPEGWVNESYVSNSQNRPAVVGIPTVIVDEEWWGDYTVRAFNLSRHPLSIPQSNDNAHLRIYVPRNN